MANWDRNSSILVFHGFLCDLDLAPRDLDALIVAESCLRPHLHGGRELEALLLVQGVVEVDLRLVYRANVGLDDGLRVPARELLLEGLHVDVVAPEAVLDHASRRLAWTETRNPDLPAEFLDLRLDALLDRLGGHLDIEPDLVLLEFRYVSRHTLQFLLPGPTRAAMCERRDLNPHAVRH